MVYTVAVCDDNAADAQRIAEYVREWGAAAGHTVRLAVFPSAEAFLFDYAENKAFDVLLLDVEMGGMTGIELAKRLRGENFRAEIIFITSHFEFSGEGYEVDALHYLVKPVTPQKLSAVLTKAAEKLQVQPRSVILTSEGETVRLAETDILYIEAFLHYCAVHTRSGEYRVRESISSFEERLGEGFFRVHRGYFVRLEAVVRITRTEAELGNGKRIPVSRAKYEALNRAFIRYC